MIIYRGVDGHLFSPQITILSKAGIILKDPKTQQPLTEEEDRYKQPKEAIVEIARDLNIEIYNKVCFVRPSNVLDCISFRGGVGIAGFDTTAEYSRQPINYGEVNTDDQTEMEKFMKNYIRTAGFEPLVPLRYRKSRLVLACQRDGIKSVEQLKNKYNNNGGIIITSEYPFITKDFCNWMGIETNGGIKPSYGRTEMLGDGTLGFADAILETVETGDSLESKNYGIVSVVTPSVPWLITDQKSYDENEDEIKRFQSLMEEARDRAIQEQESRNWFIDKLFLRLKDLMFAP